ncbi:hypothetical protein SAMN05880574_1484 [Chryseobacterium sp. RU37D]|nr:hypothetical protein SAMN05880574_1484 [Chryseobacterium sp. RU37D]
MKKIELGAYRNVSAFLMIIRSFMYVQIQNTMKGIFIILIFFGIQLNAQKVFSV